MSEFNQPTDARGAKAEAKAAKARAKAMRPWFKKKRFILPLAFVALIAIAAAGSSGSDESKPTESANLDTPATDAPENAGERSGVRSESDNTKNRPEDDVVLESCGTNALDMPEAKGKLTNHSSKPSNYTIHVDFLDASGTRVAEGLTLETEVQPGQTSTWELFGDSQSKYATCKVTRVERYAS